MSRKLAAPLIALAFVAALALGISLLSRTAPRPARAAQAPSHSATSLVGSVSVASAAAAIVPGKNPCEQASDACTCAAARGAELLRACFAERALQAVSLAPDSCTAPALLGVRAEALAAVERGEEASKLATMVLQAEPKNRFARRALAIAAIQARDFASADAALTALTTEDAKDVDSLFYLALSQRRRDRYNGAREGFLRVLRLDPQHIDARFNLVTLTATAGAAQEAEHDLQELEQITPLGDPRLTAARAAIRGVGQAAAQELPVLHQGPPAPAIAPTH